MWVKVQNKNKLMGILTVNYFQLFGNHFRQIYEIIHKNKEKAMFISKICREC